MEPSVNEIAAGRDLAGTARQGGQFEKSNLDNSSSVAQRKAPCRQNRSESAR